MDIFIKDDYIKLGQALKLSGIAGSGTEAKEKISSGEIMVNGEVEKRRGKKIYSGDVISDGKEKIRIAKG